MEQQPVNLLPNLASLPQKYDKISKRLEELAVMEDEEEAKRQEAKQRQYKEGKIIPLGGGAKKAGSKRRTSNKTSSFGFKKGFLNSNKPKSKTTTTTTGDAKDGKRTTTNGKGGAKSVAKGLSEEVKKQCKDIYADLFSSEDPATAKSPKDTSTKNDEIPIPRKPTVDSLEVKDSVLKDYVLERENYLAKKDKEIDEFVAAAAAKNKGNKLKSKDYILEREVSLAKKYQECDDMYDDIVSDAEKFALERKNQHSKKGKEINNITATEKEIVANTRNQLKNIAAAFLKMKAGGFKGGGCSCSPEDQCPCPADKEDASPSSSGGEIQSPEITVLVLGDSGVGKTSLLNRLKEQQEEATKKEITALSDAVGVVELHFPTKTKDGFVKIRCIEKKGKEPVQGILIMFDVTQPKTFDRAISKYLRESNFLAPDIPKVLVGNKCDLIGDRKIFPSDVPPNKHNQSYCDVSAKGMNLEAPFLYLLLMNAKHTGVSMNDLKFGEVEKPKEKKEDEEEMERQRKRIEIGEARRREFRPKIVEDSDCLL